MILEDVDVPSGALQDCHKWEFGDYFPPPEDPPAENTTFVVQGEISGRLDS